MTDLLEVNHLLDEIAALIEENKDPYPQLYTHFFQHPEQAFQLIESLNDLDDQTTDEHSSVYLARIFALDICIAQFQAAVEANSKLATRSLNDLMKHLAELINSNRHSLHFWLPVLNAFYDVHVELSEELKDSYLQLANDESDKTEDYDPEQHLKSISDLIHELSDLSVFEIAENFFAQSYAMPLDFFADLIIDLYSIKEGQDIALLTLLHPKKEVRDVALATIDQLINQITLSSISLSRLQAMKIWLSKEDQIMIDRWIKIQRKKEVIFDLKPVKNKITIKATEIDGTHSQGIFIQLNRNRKNKLCGFLLNAQIGLKDAWLTPFLSSEETNRYYKQAFDENVTLRDVDFDYFKLIIEHSLYLTFERHELPSLNFFEIQELLGMKFKPVKLDINELIGQLSIQITPFTEETIEKSLLRSKSWLRNKAFTESWYIENPNVDKIVNHNSSFVDGVKICRLEEAMEAVFSEEMELHREQWQFHFLWVALWAKAKEKKNERIWQDSFIIAFLIHEKKPLKDIPVLKEICYQTVINSVETMQARRTHLNKE